MTYVDGFVAAIPGANREAFLKHARLASSIFRDLGATRALDAWGDDVPKGEVTDFDRAVEAKDGEVVGFSFIEYPDKAARDAAGEGRGRRDRDLLVDRMARPGDPRRRPGGTLPEDGAADEGQPQNPVPSHERGGHGRHARHRPEDWIRRIGDVEDGASDGLYLILDHSIEGHAGSAERGRSGRGDADRHEISVRRHDDAALTGRIG